MLLISTRKLIQFGTNSFVVSIPKTWVERNRLRKGSEVLMEEAANSIMLLPNGQAQNDEIRVKKIHVDDTKRRLARRIISAYINNYNIIEIYGKGLKDQMDEIEKTAQGMVALEIMEQTNQKVIIKDFLNTQDISMKNIINRMDIIIRAMMADVQEMFVKKDEYDLEKRDIDVNRLFYVGQKLINKVLDNPSVSKNLNIDIKETMFYWRVLDSLEKIADQQKRIARSIALITDGCIAIKQMSIVYNMIIKEYTKAIKSFYNTDLDLADEILAKKGEILNASDDIITDLCDNCPVPIEEHEHKVHQSTNIVEKFKRFENYVTNLAKAIINKE